MSPGATPAGRSEWTGKGVHTRTPRSNEGRYFSVLVTRSLASPSSVRETRGCSPTSFLVQGPSLVKRPLVRRQPGHQISGIVVRTTSSSHPPQPRVSSTSLWAPTLFVHQGSPGNKSRFLGLPGPPGDSGVLDIRPHRDPDTEVVFVDVAGVRTRILRV